MKTWLAVLALALTLLTGCSSVRLVDSQVQAMATLPAGGTIAKGAHYRFERLPSQADQPRSEQVEAMAQAALSQVGLVRDEAAPRYSVLLGTRMQSYLSDPWGRPIGAPGSPYGSIMIGAGSGGGMFGWGMRMPPSTLYHYEVSLVLRDLPSGQLVYETRATHDGIWADSTRLFPVLFEAALRDFPNPPPGVHQVNIEIPR